MPRGRGDALSRSEITGKIEKHRDDMQEKADEMDETVSDVETVRDTQNSLSSAGTTEGAESVEQSIQSAEDTSVDEFDQRGQELDEVHQETQEDEDDLRNRSDTTSGDLDKITDAIGRIHSSDANGELDAARDSAAEDIEFLDDQHSQAEHARDESEQVWQAYQARVDAGRGR